MSRAKWKGPTIFIEKKKRFEKKPNLIISKRNNRVTPNLLNETVNIYNGKSFSAITITDEMIGHLLGEFVFTRKKFIFKKKKQKK